MQKGYQRTLTVLSRIRNSLCKDGLADQSIYSEDCLLQHSTSSPHFFHNYNQCVVRKNFLSGSLKVMLLCGSDLLESFSTLGVWIPDQVEILNFGSNEKTFATSFCNFMMAFLVSLWFSLCIKLPWWHQLLFPGQNYMQWLRCHMYTQGRKRYWQFDSRQWYTARIQGANL